VAGALALNIEFDAIKKGLENLKPANGRLELCTLEMGSKLLMILTMLIPFHFKQLFKHSLLSQEKNLGIR